MNMTEHLYETYTDSTEDITTSTSIETDSTEDITSTSIETDSTEDITTSTSIETDSTEDITTSTSIETDSMEDTDDTKSSASTNSTNDDDTASFTFINSTKHISDATSADNQVKTLKVELEELRRNYDNLHKLIEILAISRNHYMFPTVPNTVLSKQESTSSTKSVINQKSFKTNEDIANPIPTKQKLEKKDHISENKHGKKPQSSKKCIFTKQAAMKTPKDSTNESNSFTDDEPYIDAEQSTHSATHTDDDIRNPELSDNQEETMEESPFKCPAGKHLRFPIDFTNEQFNHLMDSTDKQLKRPVDPEECVLIEVISFTFVALYFMYFIPYLFPFYSLELSPSQNLDNTIILTDTFTSVIYSSELEEKILAQDETIRTLTKYLQQDTPLLKVVALISNASVDQYTIQNAYTIDIIKNKFPSKSNNESVSLYPSFTVLENLSLKNSKVVIDFVDMSLRAYPHDQQVIILADFKINDDLTHINLNQTINTFKKTFIRANINIKILLYKPLNDETLEKYIKNVAENIGKSFSQIQINDIKRHLIESKKPVVIARK